MLHDLHQSLAAEFMPFGPASPDTNDAPQIVATFNRYEAEYAAIRKAVGIMHHPQRGLLQLTGDDAPDFLHRMLTQDIKSMTANGGGASRRAFALTNKGRILADVIVHLGSQSIWLETDNCDIPALYELLDKRLFLEKVNIENISDQRTALAVYGPASAELLTKIQSTDSDPANTSTVEKLQAMPDTHHVINLADTLVTASHDTRCGDAGSATGGAGFMLHVPTDRAEHVYQALLDAAGYDKREVETDDNPQLAAEIATARRDTLRGRPIGWLAFNTARIENRTPMFHIDFGPDSLPGETGLLDAAVSFNKGCYPGQEIVARMKNLGHPSKCLVTLHMDDDRMPIAGSQVFAPTPDNETGQIGQVIGAVTSSALSPMRSQTAIALAMVKWDQHEPNTELRVPAEGELVRAIVAE